MVPPTDWPERKEPPEFSNPPPPRNNGNFKPKNSTREYRGQQQQQYHAGGGEGKKTHVFADVGESLDEKHYSKLNWIEDFSSRINFHLDFRATDLRLILLTTF